MKGYPVIDPSYSLTNTESRILFNHSKKMLAYRMPDDRKYHKFIVDTYDPTSDTTELLSEKNIVEYAYTDDFFSMFSLAAGDEGYLIIMSEDILYSTLMAMEPDEDEESDEDKYVPPPSLIGVVYFDNSSKLWWSYAGLITEPVGCFKTAQAAGRAVVVTYFGINDNSTEDVDD